MIEKDKIDTAVEKLPGCKSWEGICREFYDLLSMQVTHGS